MNKVIKVYDTSALLNLKEELVIDENTYIPLLVLKELEHIKSSCSKDEETKYYARKIVNQLQLVKVITKLVSLKQVERLLRKYKDVLVDNNDSRIILETKLLTKNYSVKFYTGDKCQHVLISHLFPEIESVYLEDISQMYISDGYRYIQPTNEQWEKLYEKDNNENLFNCYINEYVFLQDEDKNVKDIARWNGEYYSRLGYQPINTSYYGLITPRNLEQKCYLDMLQNPNIPIISTVSNAGTGKTMLAFMEGLAGLERGEYSKIIYIRNNYEVAQTKEIGFLEGSLQKKTGWLLGPLTSLIGEEYLEQLSQEGKFEYVHLAFIRGLTLGPDCFVIVDEAQNLTKELIKTIISRLGEGTKIVFCSDFAQRDSQLFARNSGVMAMSKALTGNDKFAQIRLKKVERSQISMLAEKI